MLGDMVITGIYVWNSRNQVPKDDETVVESRKSFIDMCADGSDPMVSAATVRINVDVVWSETYFLASIDEERTNANDPSKVFEKMTSEEIDKVEPVKVDSAIPLVSALEDDAGRYVSPRQFSRRDYKTFDMVAIFDQITSMPYPPQKVQDEHGPKLRVSVYRAGSDYNRGVLTDTHRVMANRYDTKTEKILMDDVVNER